MRLWYESSDNPNERQQLRVKRWLHSERTEYQDLDYVELPDFGKTLILDGQPQFSEMDEFIYHELIVHPLMIGLEHRARILVAGGGDGLVLPQLQKYADLGSLVQVDIDERVLDLFVDQETMPPHFTVKAGDIMEFLGRHTEGRLYDGIIFDLTDPLEGSSSCPVFEDAFIAGLDRFLTPGGAVMYLSGSLRPDRLHRHVDFIRRLRRTFEHCAVGNMNIPVFFEPWSFVVCSNAFDLAALEPEEVESRLQGLGVEGLRYYDGEAHRHLFSLPKYVREGYRAASPSSA